MAELLCGAIPRICGTVAMRPRGINGGIGTRIFGAGRFYSRPLIDPD
jgi:hypothetical protein